MTRWFGWLREEIGYWQWKLKRMAEHVSATEASSEDGIR